MRGPDRWYRLVLAAVIATPPGAAAAQTPEPDSADVASIAAIVSASYAAMSGPAGTARQWGRDSSLYMPAATYVALRERDGRTEAVVLTPEEYRQTRFPRFEAGGLFEQEIGARVERFGNVAQVRSVAEARATPEGPVLGRYVNYFQLYHDGARWWIAGMVWDEERPSALIPAEWIGQWEDTGPER